MIDFYREGYEQGKVDGKYDLVKHRDAYAILCQFNRFRKSAASYRQFLQGIRDGCNGKGIGDICSKSLEEGKQQ